MTVNNPPGSDQADQAPESSPPPPLQEQKPQPPVTQEPLGLAIKTCSRCRTPNLPDSQFCYKCGAQLPEKPTEPGEVLGVRTAGFWLRLVAYLVDTVVVGLAGGVFLSIILAAFPNALPGLPRDASIQRVIESALLPQTSAEISLVAVSYIISMLYWTILTGLLGKTPGKALCRLKVVRTDGSSVGYGRAFIRWLGYPLSFVTLGAPFVVIFFNPENRSLPDFVCDTKVIRT